MGIRIVIIALLSAPVFAQDSTYVRNFGDKLSVQLFMLNVLNEFNINYVDENTVVDIVPNQKTTLNVGVDYDIFSFSVGYAPSFFAENKDNADSKMFSFTTAFYPGRFRQWLELYSQKGMSLESETGNVSLYLPKLKSIKIGGSTSFVCNRNFSFRAVSLQNARQLRSQGSFAPGLSYYYTSLDARKEPQLGGKIYFVDVALDAAYYYNWVIAKHFLLASGASIGAGVSWTVDEENDYTAALYKASLLLAPGYNSERWYGGAQLRLHYAGHESEAKVEVGDAIGYFTAFIGYRFDAPQFLQTQKDKIKNTIKL